MDEAKMRQFATEVGKLVSEAMYDNHGGDIENDTAMSMGKWMRNDLRGLLLWYFGKDVADAFRVEALVARWRCDECDHDIVGGEFDTGGNPIRICSSCESGE